MNKPDRLCFDCVNMACDSVYWQWQDAVELKCYAGIKDFAACQNAAELGAAIRSAATCEKFEEREK